MAAAMLFGTISSDGLTARAEEQDAEWEDTELLVNGDFENETTGWTVSGGNADCKVDSNQWSTNTTNFYHVYAADDTEFSLEQKIEKVEPGTYKVVFEQDGAENMASGLQIGLGAKFAALPDTKGWDNWATCESAEYTVEEAGELTVTISGTIKAGYWGDFDNMILQKKTASDTTPDDTVSGGDSSVDKPSGGDTASDRDDRSWKATYLVANGDFESETSAEGWTISTGSDSTTWNVKSDQYATNNTTKFLNFWNGDSSDVTISVSQTLSQVPAGTYYLALDLEGKEATSELKVSVDSGEKNYTEKTLEQTTGWNNWNTTKTGMFTLNEAADLTITVSGSIASDYWMDLDNIILYQEVTEEEDIPNPVEAEIYVERVDGLYGNDDFIGGVDISSYIALTESNVTYYDFNNKKLSDQEFFNLLADSGINYVRIRVWNDPYDEDGNGYGGGNNDLDKAIKMGQWATKAGMRVLIDFHYSDFWADPGKQQAPKAWASVSSADKPKEVYNYTVESLTKLIEAGVDVGMVQVGNETNNGIAGESGWSEAMLNVFKMGCEAVHAVKNTNNENEDILAVLHFANPEKSTNYQNWAEKLDTAGVDYDVFASSYYPYWHGTLANLQSTLGKIATKYGKKVMVAETSWATTLEDGDGHDNTVREGNNDTGMDYDFTIYGQALELRSVINTIANMKNGIGVFYWEPAWIPVQTYDPNADDADEILAANKEAW